MIAPVDPYIDAFADAGADIITVHPEAGPHLHRTIQLIKSLGKRPASRSTRRRRSSRRACARRYRPGAGDDASIPASAARASSRRSSTRSARCAGASTSSAAPSISRSMAASPTETARQAIAPAPMCWSPAPRPSPAGLMPMPAISAGCAALSHASTLRALSHGSAIYHLALSRPAPPRSRCAPVALARRQGARRSVDGGRASHLPANHRERPAAMARPHQRGMAHGISTAFLARRSAALESDGAARVARGNGSRIGCAATRSMIPSLGGPSDRRSALRWLGILIRRGGNRPHVRRELKPRAPGAPPRPRRWARGRRAGPAPALRGLVAARAALGAGRALARAARLEREIAQQILADGGHRARNRNGAARGDAPCWSIARRARGSRARRCRSSSTAPSSARRHAAFLPPRRRRGRALQRRDEGDPALIDLVLARAGAKGRPRRPRRIRLRAAPGRRHGGAVRLRRAGGRGLRPRRPCRHLVVRDEHGPARIVVNCGAGAKAPWRTALRATAAHSTLIVADTNSAELGADGTLGPAPLARDASARRAGRRSLGRRDA